VFLARPGSFLGGSVLGGSWKVPGGFLKVPGGFMEGPGGSWRVPGSVVGSTFGFLVGWNWVRLALPRGFLEVLRNVAYC
jgi:hypothetical protein